MAAFIVAQREQHGIPFATACRALQVSQSWLYKWCHGDSSPQHSRREQLAAEIARLFAAHRGTYGAPRIRADLRAAGWQVSRKTVAAIMRANAVWCRGRNGAGAAPPGRVVVVGGRRTWSGAGSRCAMPCGHP